MDLQVLQAREALVAGWTMVRLLVGVCADVNQHFVSKRNAQHRQENVDFEMFSLENVDF